MKKITFFLMVLTASLGFSQIVIEDFETSIPVITDPMATPPGAAGALQGDNILEIAQEANPDPGAIVGNSQVLKVITNASAVAWQNAQLYVQDGKEIDLTDGNATGNKLVTVDVWSQAATSILAKVVDGAVGGIADPKIESATDASHPGGGWATLTFDFAVGKDNTNAANDIFSRILFFPIWNGAGYDAASEFTTYYDNITKVDATASTDDFSKLSFKAYPNPTNSSWKVSTQNAEILSVNVFDVLGKSVLTLVPNNKTVVIDGSSFKSGLYFAQIKTANSLSSIKLIRN
jgi:hypothetical protein